jgi:pyruvate dehydrogenase E1 component
MYGDGESLFYYVTLLNENYLHPGMPEGAEEGIRKGMYLLREGEGGGSKKSKKGKKAPPRVQLAGSGSILREVLAAADMLQSDFGVAADVWSATSFTELRRQGIETDRWNRLHPDQESRKAFVAESLEERQGPLVAATDYMRAVPDQIRPWVDRRFVTLGTDGFGRSDTRERLRGFFEVDRRHVVVAALHALAQEGEVEPKRVREAIRKLEIDPEAPAPWTV